MTQTSKGWFFFVHEDRFEFGKHTWLFFLFTASYQDTFVFISYIFFFLPFVVILAERKWLKGCKLLRSAGCLLDMT